MEILEMVVRTLCYMGVCERGDKVCKVQSCRIFILILWGRAEVARQAHNLEVGGSIPSPATRNYISYTASLL